MPGIFLSLTPVGADGQFLHDLYHLRADIPHLTLCYTGDKVDLTALVDAAHHFGGDLLVDQPITFDTDHPVIDEVKKDKTGEVVFYVTLAATGGGARLIETAQKTLQTWAHASSAICRAPHTTVGIYSTREEAEACAAKFRACGGYQLRTTGYYFV